jgi:hypothetical protein
MPGSDLTHEQRQLFERFAAQTDYVDALNVLIDNKSLLDDRFLLNVVGQSQQLYVDGDYGSAATIADIGSTVDDLASTRTKIDLRIAAGQAFAKLLPKWRAGATHAYASAVEVAEAASTPYMVPLAKFMLGQFARSDGSFEIALDFFQASVKCALLPQNEAPPDVLWAALKNYRATRLQLLRFEFPELSAQEAGRRVLDEALRLLPASLVGEFRARWALSEDQDVMLERWAAANARTSIVIDGIDPFAGSHVLAIAGVMYELFDQREGGRPVVAGRTERSSTNVLTDRVINQYPYFSTWVTRDALGPYPASLSTVVHEFTHYWTFLGSLGGYFSALIIELRLLEIYLQTKASATIEVRHRSRVSRAYRDSQTKLQMLWEVWRPWAEGVALFAEMDLDLAESGTSSLPLTLFLASLPAAHLTLSEPGEKPTPRRAKGDVFGAFAEVEALQSAARAQVAPTHRWNVYLGKTGGGNERCYFTGHALIGALWRQWTTRAPALGNSVAFYRALLWLSNSAFDDLIPDWRDPPAVFAAALLDRFGLFLRRLFDVPAERLADLAGKIRDDARARYDLWHFLRDGRRDQHASQQWETRTNALREELAELAFGERADQYVMLLARQRETWLGEVMNRSRVHVLSQSACEIRLLTDNPTLLCVARTLQHGARRPTSFFSINVTPEELDRLAAEARTKTSGSAQLYQFVLARRDPDVGFTYEFPLALAYGDRLEVLSAFRGAKQSTDAAELLRDFLDADSQADRLEMARAVDRGSTPGDAAELQAFMEKSGRAYLDAFVTGPAEAIERLQRDRLRAFLPQPGPERSALETALDLVMRSIDGITRDELASRMGVSSDAAMDAIRHLWTAAAILGQDLIAQDGDRLRFVGLRASAA